MLLEDGQEYAVHFGDCIPWLHSLPEACCDFSVYSPPFPSVFSYTKLESDIGNSEELRSEVPLHFSFFFRAMRRIIKPGRVMVVHCQQIARMKRAGGEGLYDFRGLLIRLGQRAGFIYDYDWLVSKNPQSAAIRTKSRALQFAGLESDRAKSRGALCDYLIKFCVPGENKVPICDDDGQATQVRRNDWIDWAEGCWPWTSIRETDTLNVREGRGEDDVRHICPLQLPVIDRLVRLYSNPGEIVVSPFTGIGSEGYISLLNHRRFAGAELKTEYFDAAIKNCERAIHERTGGDQMSIWDALNPEPVGANQ